MVVALVVMVGCGTTLPTSDPDGLDSIPTTPVTTAPVPSDLLDIESGAEDTFESVLKDDASAVDAGLVKIQDGFAAYRGHAVGDGAPQAIVDRLELVISELADARAEAQTGLALARITNKVSAPIPRLFAGYTDPVPPTVLVLDYVGRELMLDAKQRTSSQATADLERAVKTWDTLRPIVVAKGGAPAAAKLDTTLADLRAALDAGDFTALEAAAVTELDDVDTIEGVFAN